VQEWVKGDLGGRENGRDYDIYLQGHDTCSPLNILIHTPVTSPGQPSIHPPLHVSGIREGISYEYKNFRSLFIHREIRVKGEFKGPLILQIRR
jgi:hypothetical protein